MAAISTKPGVYLAARDLGGSGLRGAITSVGTHLFLIILTGPSSSAPFFVSYRDPNTASATVVKNYNLVARDLSGKNSGPFGIVAGAQNKQGRLLLEYFEANDFQATLEHFNWSDHGSKFAPDLDTEVHMVDPQHSKWSATLLAQTALGLMSNYVENEDAANIPYPTLGNGTNSNSFAQSVVEYAGWKAPSDYIGLDLSGGMRVPRAYFNAHVSANALPPVNKFVGSPNVTPTHLLPNVGGRTRSSTPGPLPAGRGRFR